MINCLQKLNVILVQSFGEADFEIAQYCYFNNCFAVLSQDTDFLVFNHSLSYIPLNSIRIGFDSLSCRLLERESLSESLGITPQVQI